MCRTDFTGAFVSIVLARRVSGEMTSSEYRKQEVYSLSWDQTDLSKFLIAGAQFGGPIGKRTEKAVARASQPSSPGLIYAAQL